MKKTFFIFMLIILVGLVGCTKKSIYHKYYYFKEVDTYDGLTNEEAYEILNRAVVNTLALKSYNFKTSFRQLNKYLNVNYYITNEVKQSENKEALKIFKKYSNDVLEVEVTEYVDKDYSYVKYNYLGKIKTYKRNYQDENYIEKITGIKEFINYSFEGKNVKSGTDSAENTIIDVQEPLQKIRFVINSDEQLVFVHSFIEEVEVDLDNIITTKENIIEIFNDNPRIEFPKEIYNYPIKMPSI